MIWFAPPEERFPIIRRISRQLPTVVFGSRVPEECNSLTVDYTEESYQEGKELLREGRSSFWGIMNNDPGAELYLRGYRKALEEAGKRLDPDMTCVRKPSGCCRSFRSIFNSSAVCSAAVKQ